VLGVGVALVGAAEVRDVDVVERWSATLPCDDVHDVMSVVSRAVRAIVRMSTGGIVACTGR
jgi:hypothetical protein